MGFLDSGGGAGEDYLPFHLQQVLAEPEQLELDVQTEEGNLPVAELYAVWHWICPLCYSVNETSEQYLQSSRCERCWKKVALS